MRIYEREIEIFDLAGELLRRHAKKRAQGQLRAAGGRSHLQPLACSAHLRANVHKIGPHCACLAREIFAHLGRSAQKAICALCNLARHHRIEEIEQACERVLALPEPSYQALKRILAAQAAAKEASAAADTGTLQQQGEHIRQIDEYQRFFDQHAGQLSLLPDAPVQPPPQEPTR